MPSQTFSHTATANAAIVTVWSSLDQPETWEAISGIDRVFDSRVDERGRLRGFSFDTEVAGKKYVGQATPSTRDEGRAIGWNVSNSEITGTLDVTLAEDRSGTRITVALEVASRSFLTGMFFGVIAGAIGNGLPRAVEDFAAGFS